MIFSARLVDSSEPSLSNSVLSESRFWHSISLLFDSEDSDSNLELEDLIDYCNLPTVTERAEALVLNF